MTLDLIPGITETEQYKAWKFPGGEIHFKLKPEVVEELRYCMYSGWPEELFVRIRLTSPDMFFFLAIVTDTIYKDFNIMPKVNIGYMPYQQADRDFGEGECFSLHTVCLFLNSLLVDEYIIFDPHSDVTPALINNIAVGDNSEFVKYTLNQIMRNTIQEEHITILSPDAGAYKKIFKLCEKIGFKGRIETANKYRDTTNGEIQTRLSCEDFGAAPYVLIVDDICMGGRTFINLAQQIKEAKELYLAVSHGVFNNGYDELYKYFTHIFTTNSFQDFENKPEQITFRNTDHSRLKVFRVL